jgi:uncharacterized protein YuzE
MTVKIAGIEYDNVEYDADALYLWEGAPRVPASDDASLERHYLQFDAGGKLIAITIVNAKRILEREGQIPITLPEHRIEATDLAGVLAAA